MASKPPSGIIYLPMPRLLPLTSLVVTLRATAVPLALLVAACSPPTESDELPPLPEIRVESFEPGVREQVQTQLQAVATRPRDVEAVGELGMTLHAYGYHGQALLLYERAESLDRSDWRWPYLRGSLLSETGSPSQARTELEKAFGLSPYLPGALRLAGLALESGDLTASETWADRSLRLDHTSAHAHLARARVEYRRGRFAGAAEECRQALASAAEFDAARYLLSLSCRAQGDLDGAAAILEQYRGRVLPPPDPLLELVTSRRIDAEHLLERGISYFRRREFAKALPLFEQALASNPSLVMARYNMGLALQALGNHERAIEEYRAFLALRPQNADARNNLGLSYFELGRLPEAIDAFERLKSDSPNYVKARVNLAMTRARRGDLEGAMNEYQGALAIDPHNIEALVNLANLWLHRGDRETASSLFVAALRDNPTEARALAGLRLCLRTGAASRRATDPAQEDRTVADFLLSLRMPRAAEAALRQGLRQRRDPRTVTALGRLLATADDPSVRRPQEAIRWLEPLCAAKEDPVALESLMEAYAAAGRLTDAVTTASRALESLSRSEPSSSGRDLERRISERLSTLRKQAASHE